MKQLIIPWLATFLFGCGVFVVGKMFQRAERIRREERKAALAEKQAAIEREDLLVKELAQVQRKEQNPDMGIMAAASGSGQQTGRYVH
jgi:hypothetical protein